MRPGAHVRMDTHSQTDTELSCGSTPALEARPVTEFASRGLAMQYTEAAC